MKNPPHADDPLVPPLPANVPQSRKGISCRIGAAWLRLTGWRLVGEIPDLPKAVLIVAPHSSNWDGFHGLAMKQVLGIDVAYFAKKQLFWWPLGPILRASGGIAIDRHASGDLVHEAAERFASQDRLWVGLTPEGTRKRVARWKTGFWRIARAAGVPIVTAYFNYPEKRAGIGPVFHTSADMEADIARIRASYTAWRGKGGKPSV